MAATSWLGHSDILYKTHLTASQSSPGPSSRSSNPAFVHCKIPAMKIFIVILLLLVCSLGMLIAQDAEISCGTVIADVAPCLDFIKSNKQTDQPSAACCNGVKSLASLLVTESDKEAACNCIKEALGKIGPYDPNSIPMIPIKCNLTNIVLPPISQGTDCSKVYILSPPGIMGMMGH